MKVIDGPLPRELALSMRSISRGLETEDKAAGLRRTGSPSLELGTVRLEKVKALLLHFREALVLIPVAVINTLRGATQGGKGLFESQF